MFEGLTLVFIQNETGYETCDADLAACFVLH